MEQEEGGPLQMWGKLLNEGQEGIDLDMARLLFPFLPQPGRVPPDRGLPLYPGNRFKRNPAGWR